MKKAFGGFSIALALLGLLPCAAAVYQTMRVPSLLEYASLAGSNASAQSGQAGDEADFDRSLVQDESAQTPVVASGTELYDDIKRLEDYWEDIDKVVSSRTVWGHTASATVAEKDMVANAASAPVYAIGPGYASVYPMLALSGRLMYEDELVYGDAVAVLDEGLALKLFQSTDIAGKEIVVNEKAYRVVGTVYGKRAMGDSAEYRLYVPLMAVAKSGGLDVEVLTVGAVPQPAAGAYEAMGAQMSQWNARGSLHDTRKEREMTILGMRWTAGFLLVALLIWAVKRLVGLGKSWIDGIRAGLREQYMVRLLPGAVGKALLWVVGFGVLAVCAYFVFTFITEPILIFPEWVPAVPVEPESIYETFWNLQWTNNELMEVRTPSILRLRHFATMANVGTVFFLLSLILAVVKYRRRQV